MFGARFSRWTLHFWVVKGQESRVPLSTGCPAVVLGSSSTAGSSRAHSGERQSLRRQGAVTSGDILREFPGRGAWVPRLFVIFQDFLGLSSS